MEIDEYQDYEKAQGALNEALKCLNKAKSKNPTGIEARVKFLTERLQLVKRFADARKLVRTRSVRFRGTNAIVSQIIHSILFRLSV